VGHLLDLAGQDSLALIELRRAMDIDSTNPPALLMTTQLYSKLGRKTEARALADRLYRLVPAWGFAAVSAMAQLGDPEPARRLLRDVQREEDGRISAPRRVHMLMTYLSLRDTSRALDELERLTDAGENWPTQYSACEREFDVIRHSRRFAVALQRVGLDARIFTSPTGGRPR